VTARVLSSHDEAAATFLPTVSLHSSCLLQHACHHAFPWCAPAQQSMRDVASVSS
jgi:hypothetical protein